MITKGPWAVTCERDQPNAYHNITATAADHPQREIALVPNANPDSRGNARLIAAAPLLYAAVKYVLDRRQTDPDLGHYICPVTEAYAKLCDAQAAAEGLTSEDMRTVRSSDLQPSRRKREPDVVVLRRRVEELEERIAELEGRA